MPQVVMIAFVPWMPQAIILNAPGKIVPNCGGIFREPLKLERYPRETLVKPG